MTRVADLFAGWGGFSIGAEMAGCDVVFAANHWELAVQAHSINHPTARHACQDLRQYDWQDMPEYDVLCAAPACQGHSQASQPKRRHYHDALRATAWAIVDCADVTEPRAIVVENVPDFKRWRLYPVWRQALEGIGYTLSEQVVRASHHGVPQRRDRLFVMATKSGSRVRVNPTTSEPGFGPCLDPEASRWKHVSQATPSIAKRIAKGRGNHGARFLTQHVTGHPGVGLHEPIRTVTTKVQWGLVDHDHYRMLTVRELARGMGFPDTYGWPKGVSNADAVKGLGNAVCPPVGRDVVRAVLNAA
jgi:DNA (cytosine-5)-methyltransferase 1